MGLRATRSCVEVDERNGAVLWPAASDLEKAVYSLDLRITIDDSAPQTGGDHFRQQAGRYLLAKRSPIRVPSGGVYFAAVLQPVESCGVATDVCGTTQEERPGGASAGRAPTCG